MSVRAVVSVVIPTRDRRALLGQSLARALAQTVPVEVIVVDDGSRDDTAAWLSALPALPLRVHRHASARGGGTARNVGAAMARGRWLAFCDDDDLWAPTKLAEQLAALAAQPAALWSASGCVFVDARGQLVGAQRLQPADVAAQLRLDNVIPGGGSSLVVDRGLFAAVGGFATDLGGAHDWELAIRLAARSPLAYVDRPLVAYRRWPGNRSRDTKRAARARAAIASRHGLSFAVTDAGRSSQHEARLLAEASRRGGAARAWLNAAGSLRAPGQLAYAAAVLVSPARVLARLTARDLAAAPAGWLDEARGWLEQPAGGAESD